MKSAFLLKTAIILFLPILMIFVSCKHEPEEIVIIDPVIPIDTVPTGLTCDPDTVYFRNDVLPLLISSCGMSGCHDASTAQEGVILTSYQSVMGTAEIIPGNPGRSKLYEAITDGETDERMPPPPMSALSADQILMIRKWIEQGARNNYCDAICDTTSFTFSGAVMPIINKNCKGCHTGINASGSIRLEDYATVKAAADNGSLYGAVSHQQGYSPMPKNGTKLPECNIIQLRRWIENGSPND
ncbi:MAG: hypothetical protein IPF68_03910 [Bacteroidales bacterium]|nr:hypothetical protein [Bacteroidales bacterium]